MYPALARGEKAMKAKHWIPCLLAVLVAGGALWLFLTPGEAEAGSSSKTSEIVAYLKGDAPMNLKLCALNDLRKIDETGVEAAVEGLARGSDRRLAIYACTALGKKKTTVAKTKLKGLVGSSSTDKQVRKSAMTAIAVHWKSLGDLTYLDQKSKGDSDLRAHYLFLKSKIYKQ